MTNDLERVVQAVLNTQQAAYVALLNAYIALVAENAALRAQADAAAGEQDSAPRPRPPRGGIVTRLGGETARRGESEEGS